jgi:ectoine hydroxylase-related dioxygenase (phytanoyl-CoA dioxygenase family)
VEETAKRPWPTLTVAPAAVGPIWHHPAMACLSTEEALHYHREGWLIPRYRLPAERIARLAAALEALLRDNPGVRPEKLVSAHVEGDSSDGPNRDGVHREGVNREGVKGHRDFLALARDPEIVELVSGVIGDDVILWGCHVFCKPAGHGYATPWHQDGHYWPIRPLANCTVWVALEPSTVANGCTRTCTKTATTSRSTSGWPTARSTRARLSTWSCSPGRCRCTTST